jgi:hypothetical protein
MLGIPLITPLLNPLVERLAMRLGRQKTPAKSLVIPQAGEEANVKGIMTCLP